MPPTPPYFGGRFCNGKVWSEHLADLIHAKPGYDTVLDSYALAAMNA